MARRTIPTYISWLLAVVVAATQAGCRGSTSSAPPPPVALVGTWTGAARIVNDWVVADDLAVQLEIAVDGSVVGRVGDAQVVQGRIRPSRGDLGRWIGIRTDWIVEGQLEGALIAAEGLERDSIKLPLNQTDDFLVGGLHAGSWKLGTRSRLVSAADLELVRTPD